MTGGKPSFEQVALSHLLDNAYEEFSKSLHSISARFVLWASFRSAAELQQHYFCANDKVHLLDGRRSKSLSPQEVSLKEVVNDAAIEAEEYIVWARSNSRQPILREMLISYCSAFEACLKNIALVFALAEKKKNGLDDQVFVGGDEFRRTLRDIQDKWKEARDGDRSTAEGFFELKILGAGFMTNRYKFLPMSAPEWLTCRAAFQARNALVHQLGRPTVTIEIADHALHAGWPIELSPDQLQAVRRSLLNILKPFDPFDLARL